MKHLVRIGNLFETFLILFRLKSGAQPVTWLITPLPWLQKILIVMPKTCCSTQVMVTSNHMQSPLIKPISLATTSCWVWRVRLPIATIRRSVCSGVRTSVTMCSSLCKMFQMKVPSSRTWLWQSDWLSINTVSYLFGEVFHFRSNGRK